MNIGASEQANGKQEYQYKNISHYQEEYDIWDATQWKANQ